MQNLNNTVSVKKLWPHDCMIFIEIGLIACVIYFCQQFTISIIFTSVRCVYV